MGARLENRFFGSSGPRGPLTISAEGKSYVLPPRQRGRRLAGALPQNLLTRCRN